MKIQSSILLRIRRGHSWARLVTAFLFGCVLLWATGIKAQTGSTNLTSLTSALDSTQSPDEHGDAGLPDETPAPGTPAAPNWFQYPVPPPTVTSGRLKNLNQHSIKAEGTAGSAATSSLCFQPGLGWQRRSADVIVADSAFQSVPSPALAGIAKARRMPHPADSSDCIPPIGGASPSPPESAILSNAGTSPSSPNQENSNQVSNHGGANQALRSGRFAPGVSTNGTSGNSGSATANSQSRNPASSLGSSGQGNPGPLTAPVVAPGESGTDIQISGEPEQGSTRIVPLITSEGDLFFSIRAPQVPTVDPAGAIQEPVVSVVTYSFAPGLDAGLSQSMMGEQTKNVSQSTLQKERNQVVGQKSQLLKAQEKSASTETPVLTADLHVYRQLKLFCIKVLEVQQSMTSTMGSSADTSDLLRSMDASGGHKVTELLRLGKDCGQFLAMDRDTAIRQLQKHKGLK